MILLLYIYVSYTMKHMENIKKDFEWIKKTKINFYSKIVLSNMC